ncbi:Ig-like domain-containing protein [Brevibacterium aurantiacum]|uniref:Uncharacterized protein n=1 Tax=Brevibacterium aurantiacum TaxID=273384 RepID=A0A556CJI2_BREAU|nr:Ig-like domain-containing protein [Brevibacterium aurantiacum]TSI17593.1 hypothetical protein FO013_05090 [Brevibacterium aurantiacum]
MNTLLSDPTSQSKATDSKTPNPSFTIPADEGDEGDDDETDKSASNEPSDTSNPFGDPGRDNASGGQPDDGSDTFAMPQAPSDNAPYIPDPTGPGSSDDDEEDDKGTKGDEGDKGSDDREGSSPIVPPGPPNPNPGDDDDAGSGSSDGDDGTNTASASASANANNDSDGSGSDPDSNAGSDSAQNGNDDSSGDNASSDASSSDGGSTGSSDGSSNSDGSDSNANGNADTGGGDDGEDPDPQYPPVAEDSVVNGLNDKRGEAGATLLVTEAPEDKDAFETSDPFGQIEVTVTDGDAIDELLASALDRFNLLRDYGEDAVVVVHVETEESADGIRVSVSYEVFTPIEPVAEDDEATIDTAKDESALIDVTGNDDFHGDITIAIVDAPKYGQAAVEGTSIRYTPEGGDSTSDSLKYSLTDSRGKTAEAKVTIAIERSDESSEPEPTKSVPVSVPTAQSAKESAPAQ